jgi:hypothetical protein
VLDMLWLKIEKHHKNNLSDVGETLSTAGVRFIKPSSTTRSLRAFFWCLRRECGPEKYNFTASCGESPQRTPGRGCDSSIKNTGVAVLPSEIPKTIFVLKGRNSFPPLVLFLKAGVRLALSSSAYR